MEFRSENWGAGHSGLGLDSFATVTQTLELGGKRGARRGAALARAEMARGRVRHDARNRRRFVHGLSGGRPPAGWGGDPDREPRRARRTRAHPRTPGGGGICTGRRTRAPRRGSGTVAVAAVRAEAAAHRAFLELRALAALPEGATAAALVRPEPVPVPSGDPGELAANAAAVRPDVRAAMARVETAERALRLENSLRIPDLMVNTGLKRTLDTNTGVLAVGVGLPLFDRNQVGTALARGEVRAAELERDFITRQAEADAAAALLAARRLTETAAEAARRLVEPSTIARTAMRSAFDVGTADPVSMVDAERAFADARLLENDIRIEAVAAAIAARLALGEAPLP